MGVKFTGGFKSIQLIKVSTSTNQVGLDAIAYFKGDEATSTSWADSKGNAPTLNVTGSGTNPSIDPFLNGLNAPRFFGNFSPYFTETSSFHDFNQLTCIVVYKPIITTQWNFIVGKDDFSWGNGWGIEMNNNDVGGYFADDSGPDNRQTTNSGSEHIVGLVGSVSSGTYTTWVAKLSDPVSSVTTLSGTSNTTYNPTPYNFNVGGVATDLSWRFNGQIADILIWDRELTRAEFDSEFDNIKLKYAL
jgi:hypothetical protein